MRHGWVSSFCRRGWTPKHTAAVSGTQVDWTRGERRFSSDVAWASRVPPHPRLSIKIHFNAIIFLSINRKLACSERV